MFPPHVGGSGRWFWELYRRLPRGQVVIAAGEHPQAAEFDRTHDLNVQRLALDFPDLGLCSLRGLTRYQRAVRQVSTIALREDSTAIHCGAILPDGWIGRQVARKLRLPYLVYLHGEELCYTESSRQLNWMARRVLGDARTVIVNSRNTERIAVEHWRLPAVKVHLLHPGVDCSRFVPAARDTQVRNRLGWGDRPVILTAGRLQKRKGHEQIIRALPRIRLQIPKVLYAIVGEGTQRHALEQAVAELSFHDCVKLHGEIPDDELVSAYQQCDVFALPNLAIAGDIEGFGIVLLEAQACGKPAVTGDSGGTREAVNAPDSGLVIPFDQNLQLEQALADLLRDEKKRVRMGLAGRHWVATHFDWEQLVQQALGIFSARPVGSAAARRPTSLWRAESRPPIDRNWTMTRPHQ